MKANKLIKLISTLLAVLMLVGAATVVASAAETSEPTYSTKTGGTPTYDYMNKVLNSADEKIATMDYRYGTDKYELYVDAYSGEVAIRSKATGEVLLTNPYNIGSSTATSSTGTALSCVIGSLLAYASKTASSISST